MSWSNSLTVACKYCLIILYVGCDWTTAAADDEQAVGLQKLCYTCTLMQTVYAENDHYAGDMECIKPTADSTDINRIECDEPCAKVYHRNDDGFLLVRSCMKNCVETDRENGFTRCCLTSLCNSSISNYNKYSTFVATVFSLTAISTLAAFVSHVM